MPVFLRERWLRCLLAACTLLGAAAALPAAATELRAGLGLLRDPGRQLSIDDIAGREFAPLPDGFNVGFTRDAVWVRIPPPPLAPDPGERRDWVLELTHPFHDDVRLYSARPGGGWREQRGGEDVAPAARAIDYRHPAFLLERAELAGPVYLRIVSRNSILGELHLIEETDLYRKVGREGMIYGLFFGIYLAIICFHLFFWRWTGEAVSGWYLLYVANSFITAMIATGYLQQHLAWSSQLIDDVLAVSQCLSVWALARFSLLQLDMRSVMPRTERVIRWVTTVPVFAFAVIAVAVGYAEGVVPMQVLALSVSMAMVILPALLWWRGHPPARFFFFAFGVLFLGIAMRYLTTLNILPATDLSTYAYQIGAAAHMILMSLAITSRYNELKRKVADAQRESLAEKTRLAAKLEQDVIDRTASLVEEIRRREALEDELRRALAVEQRARQEQRDFVAMVSHEFRTPLALISTSVQQLASHLGAPPEKSLERCQNIRQAAVRLTDLMDDYLSLDRMEGDAKPLTLRHTQLDDVLNAVVAEWDVEQLEFDDTGVAAGCSLVCDPSLLHIALRNLVNNAIRHSPPGVAVQLGVIAEPGDLLRFDVVDRGSGIPADEIPRLFQKYFRGRAAQGRPGAGLGLYLVSRIVALHGGTIEVDSALGRGTRFTVRVPLGGPQNAT